VLILEEFRKGGTRLLLREEGKRGGQAFLWGALLRRVG